MSGMWASTKNVFGIRISAPKDIYKYFYGDELASSTQDRSDSERTTTTYATTTRTHRMFQQERNAGIRESREFNQIIDKNHVIIIL